MLFGKSLGKKALVVFACMLCAAFTLLPVTAYAGTNQTGYWGNTQYNKHVDGNENITIAQIDDAGDIAWENVAYCFNMNRGYPVGAYDGSTFSNSYDTLDAQDSDTWKSLSENQG